VNTPFITGIYIRPSGFILKIFVWFTARKRINFEETLERTAPGPNIHYSCDYCENLYIQRYKKKSKATAKKGTVIYLPTVLAGNQGYSKTLNNELQN